MSAADSAAARAAREVALANLAEHEADVQARQLCRLADVQRGICESAPWQRDDLVACASRLASRLAGAQSAVTCSHAIEQENRRVLIQWAKTWGDKIAAAPKRGTPT